MTRIPWLLLGAFALVNSAGCRLGKAPIPNTDLRSAKITYRYTLPIQNDPRGAAREFRIIRYIDFQNNRERTETRHLVRDIWSSPPVAEIKDAQSVYDIDADRNVLFSTRAYSPDTTRPVWTFPSIGNPMGQALVAGKLCAVSSNESGWKVWIWNSIMLKEVKENAYGRHVVKEALEVLENPYFDASLLDPSGYAPHGSPTDNPHDICRLDDAQGGNIRRQFLPEKEECLARVCSVLGPLNAKRGTRGRCVFQGETITEY